MFTLHSPQCTKNYEDELIDRDHESPKNEEINLNRKRKYELDDEFEEEAKNTTNKMFEIEGQKQDIPIYKRKKSWKMN